MVIRNKKAAIEMSMNTIITIILAVVFLILGLTLLRGFYQFQSESVGAVQDKTLNEINKIYLSGEPEAAKIMISLGSEKIAKIRAGTETFGIELGGGTAARIFEGSQLQFMLNISRGPGDCVAVLGEAAVKAFFKTKLGEWVDSLKFSEAAGATVVYLTIPPATRTCTQIVTVQSRDRTISTEQAPKVQDYFTIEVLRKLPFT